MSRPGLLFILNELRPGGAEMFVIRLARFMQSEYSIHVHSCFPDHDDPAFVAQFAAEVPFIRFPSVPHVMPKWKEHLFWKINALGVALGRPSLFVKLGAWDKRRFFRNELKQANICIVNSSESHSDSFAVNYLKKHFGIPVVLSVHSAYNRENWGTGEKQIAFFEAVRPILHGTDALLYTADHNLEIFNHVSRPSHVLMEKVYLGYEPKEVTATRSDLDWADDAFVVTMMARGIPEKGWEQALSAFSMLLGHHPNSLLVLIHTDTAYMQALQAQYAHEHRIRFMGYVADPSAILKHSDCSILPSHFPESLPYAITESLAYGTPVFATGIAEIPQMLHTDEGLAGGIIPMKEGKADAAHLAEQLLQAATVPAHLKEMRRLVGIAFRKFSMEHCGERYKDIFDKLRHGKA